MREKIGNLEAKLNQTCDILTELKQMMAQLAKDSFKIKGTNYEVWNIFFSAFLYSKYVYMYFVRA
jgi:hypothetical protein